VVFVCHRGHGPRVFLGLGPPHTAC
jgi:hypothetical protein